MDIAYQQVTFELFCLTKLLYMEMVRNFEVMLKQTARDFVQNSLTLWNVTYLTFIKFDTTLFQLVQRNSEGSSFISRWPQTS
jgi:hypothetical protein